MKPAQRRILFATTIAESAVFLEPLYARAQERAEVFLLFGPDGGDAERWGVSGHTTLVANIARSVDPKRDGKALVQVFKLLKQHRIDTVVYGTPKASLIVSIAAALARVPLRVFVLHGLRHETLKGPVGWFMWMADAIASRTSHVTVAVSGSARTAAIDAMIVSPQKVRVMGAGSVAGIDSSLFRPSENAEREAIREELGFGADDVVVGYVGRIAKDKGIAQLVDASHILRRRGVEHRLLLVGGLDESDPLPSAVQSALQSTTIDCLGHRDDIPRLLRAMDIFVLPSHREGLGLSALEASASGLPVVGTAVTGVVDAVRDRETGILVAPRDADAMADALGLLCADAALRDELGAAGRHYVVSAFATQDRLDAWSDLLELECD